MLLIHMMGKNSSLCEIRPAFLSYRIEWRPHIQGFTQWPVSCVDKKTTEEGRDTSRILRSTYHTKHRVLNLNREWLARITKLRSTDRGTSGGIWADQELATQGLIDKIQIFQQSLKPSLCPIQNNTFFSQFSCQINDIHS